MCVIEVFVDFYSLCVLEKLMLWFELSKISEDVMIVDLFLEDEVVVFFEEVEEIDVKFEVLGVDFEWYWVEKEIVVFSYGFVDV